MHFKISKKNAPFSTPLSFCDCPTGEFLELSIFISPDFLERIPAGGYRPDMIPLSLREIFVFLKIRGEIGLLFPLEQAREALRRRARSPLSIFLRRQAARQRVRPHLRIFRRSESVRCISQVGAPTLLQVFSRESRIKLFEPLTFYL